MTLLIIGLAGLVFLCCVVAVALELRNLYRLINEESQRIGNVIQSYDKMFAVVGDKLAELQQVKATNQALDQETKATLRLSKPCVHCGGWHASTCMRLRKVEYQGDRITRVEFWPWGEWPHESVVWPEDVYQEEADSGQ